MTGSVRKPSICIVSHKAYGAISGGSHGSIGGVEWQTSLTARWLAEHGYPVSMLTWDEGGPSEETIDGVRIVKICSREAGLPGFRFLHPRWTGLVGAMRRVDADLYYHNCGEAATGQIALWCRWNRKAFVFASASDADCTPDLPELRSVRDRAFYRYGLRSADFRIVQTEVQHALLKKSFGLQSAVVRMPCPTPRNMDLPRTSVPWSKRILWLGRVCKVKRPDRLLDVAESFPDLCFDLVGPIYSDNYAHDVIQRAKQIPNVTVHGPVSRAQVSDLLRNTALLCCTSDYEGFPNSFLEAWSHGVPIVSTVDPDRLIVQRGLGCVAEETSGLGKAIRTLLHSDGEYRIIAANTRQYFLENHTVEAVLPRFEAIFLNAVQGKQ